MTAPEGHRLHYLEAGPRDGPSILFVPGWTMPAQIWEEQLRHLHPDWRAVAMEPGAHGLSDRPPGALDLARLGADIRAVIVDLGLEPTVVVAWSLAVIEVLRYVESFGTSTLTALVLVDGIAGADRDPLSEQVMGHWIVALERDRQRVTEAFVRSMYRGQHDEAYVQLITAAALRTPTEAAVALLRDSLVNDCRGILPAIDRPTLVVAAPGPSMPRVRAMADAIPGSRFELFEDAGHALFVDEPGRFNALLDDFLAALG